MPARGPELPSKRVETDLRRRATAGEWRRDEKLPSVASLAAHYGVARSTVVSALRRMETDGLVEIVANWGTFRRLGLPALLRLSTQLIPKHRVAKRRTKKGRCG